MTRNFFGASLLCLALIACGGGEKEENPAPEDETVTDEPVVIEVDEPDLIEDEPEEPAGIEITRVLGTFEGDVTGLAFSRNPGRPQASSLLAANGGAGIAIIPTSEGGEASVYAPAGREASGAAATLVGPNGDSPLLAIETASDSGNQLDFATFTEDRSDLVIVASAADGLRGRAAGFCFASEALFRISEGGVMTRHAIEQVDGAITVSAAPVAIENAMACASAGDVAYAVDTQLARYILDAAGSPKLPGMPMPPAPEGMRGFTVMPLEAKDALFFVLEDGRVQTEEKTFSFTMDGEFVEVVRLTAAPGNFGGVNRNGVMAVLTADNQLGLVSWLSIANYLDLPAETVERIAEGHKEEDGISFTPQIDLPAPPPPSGDQ